MKKYLLPQQSRRTPRASCTSHRLSDTVSAASPISESSPAGCVKTIQNTDNNGMQSALSATHRATDSQLSFGQAAASGPLNRYSIPEMCRKKVVPLEHYQLKTEITYARHLKHSTVLKQWLTLLQCLEFFGDTSTTVGNCHLQLRSSYCGVRIVDSLGRVVVGIFASGQSRLFNMGNDKLVIC